MPEKLICSTCEQEIEECDSCHRKLQAGDVIHCFETDNSSGHYCDTEACVGDGSIQLSCEVKKVK